MKKPKIIGLIAFRDEKEHLPGYFSHLRDYLDGFIAFDDCSADDSKNIASSEPKMIELLGRNVPSEDHFFEIDNRLALLNSAHKIGAEWLLCGDADERFETRFLEHLPSLLQNPPAKIIALQLVAVWEKLSQYRVGSSQKTVLFPCAEPNPYYQRGLLHQQWYPPRFHNDSKKTLDFFLYHLGSISRSARVERHKKFNRIDPHRFHQPQGYDHLINENNLVIKEIEKSRSFRYD